jgi:thiol-disulfide isomerase/thioredoxin
MISSKLKKISYTCPKCKELIETFVDLKEFEGKDFPVVITDVHGKTNERHANTLYLDEQFVIRAIETSDVTAQQIDDGITYDLGEELTEIYLPIPKENIKPKGLGFIENLLLKRIDGKKTTIDLAEELKLSEKRVRMVAKKLQVNGYIKQIKRVIK